MIKKILMISDNDITSSESLGVTKKLLGQYKAFGNLGYDTYHLCFKDEKGVLIHGDDVTVLVNKKAKMYFTYIKLFGLAHKVCRENDIDMCYIRYPLADFAFMKMLKKLQKICKVVVELPTYPYDEENKNVSFITRFIFKQDLKNRYKLKNYVDLIADIGDRESIYGIKCVNIFNSVDVSAIKFCKKTVRTSDELRFISVALIRKDHRFDRLILGLKDYYENKGDNKPNVYFDIVGNCTSDEKDKLVDLVNVNSLNKYVTFYGVKTGQELDCLFDNADLAISTFNALRDIVGKTSVLKTREYCARGIPFVSSLYDLAFPEDIDFCKIVESSENPIDVGELVDFADYVKSHPEIHDRMRHFAEENLTWEKQLKKVLDAIENE